MVPSLLLCVLTFKVDDTEKAVFADQLRASSQKGVDSEAFFKVILSILGVLNFRSISSESRTLWKSEECSFEVGKHTCQSQNSRV
jgi:hypothetical protein